MSASQRLQNLGLNNASNVVIDGKHYDTYTEPPKVLEKERSKVNFNTREVTYYLDGGKKATERFEAIMQSIERNPLFNNDKIYDLNKEEIRELTLERVADLSQNIMHESEEEFRQRFVMIGLADMSTYTRTGVHFGLFLNAIRGSGTDEQLGYWIAKGSAELKKQFGCFAMTEIGHGSNVAGLETTATFDRNSDEFIIHTPNEAATKWWIGGAAHTATHTVCFARLIVDGKDYGVKSFVVPLRNLHDFSLLRGIAIGDIGKKMGRDGIDNGWIQFTQVRIPRQYMLMKYAKVDSEGHVTQPPLAQLAYGALITGRVNMASDSFHVAKRFLTIAIRYGAIRRQFSSTPGQPETVLLDYPYHQRRLITRLSYAFAMNAGSSQLFDLYTSATSSLASAKKDDKESLNAAIEDVKELFSVSAGVKAFTTWATAEIIDQTRQSCGGHGYSGYNGFGQAYNDWVVQCTWEGDNNVLTLSAGRSLIQSGLAARQGKKVGSAVSYITRANELKNSKLNGRDIRDPKVIIEAWESVSARLLYRTVDLFEKLLASGSSAEQAFEALSQQRFESARVHTRLYLIRAFYDRIQKRGTDGSRDILSKVATLFSLWSTETDSGLFLQAGFLVPDDLDVITKYVDEYCAVVREQAIGLTDAFNLSDYFINSPIGNYDGNAYKNYFNKVKALNPSVNSSKAPYYETKIKPFLFREEIEDDEPLPN